MKKIHNLVQGSPEWHSHRATPNMINGSEIAAIMGLDKKTSRSELLRMKATGGEKEFSDYVQKYVLAKGHENEALARPLAESIIDDDLSPLVMTDTIGEVLFSVSLDGINQASTTTFEHKSLNAALIAALDDSHLPAEYESQCEAGLMVSGAIHCLFMASKDGDTETARHYWYLSKPALRSRMIAECKQFLSDVANYQHADIVAAPVAATTASLPVLFVQVEGRVLSTNLEAYKAVAMAGIADVNTRLAVLKTDQDFADAMAEAKRFRAGTIKLKAVKDQALAQTASIDELFRTIDAITAEMDKTSIRLEKAVKADKENAKSKIISDANYALSARLATLSTGAGITIPATVLRFADVIKGMSSLDKMREAVDTALRGAIFDAVAVAETITSNRSAMVAAGADHLFPDFASVCTKQADDFAGQVAVRIAAEVARNAVEREKMQAEADKKAADTLAAETKRIQDEAAAAERENIRKETAITHVSKKAEQQAVVVAPTNEPAAVKKTEESQQLKIAREIFNAVAIQKADAMKLAEMIVRGEIKGVVAS